jgi:hypothetical protein
VGRPGTCALTWRRTIEGPLWVRKRRSCVTGHLLRVGAFIIARRYSYARAAQFASADEAIVLEAMCHARFSLWGGKAQACKNAR